MNKEDLDKITNSINDNMGKNTNPNHYKQGKLETWDNIRNSMTSDMYVGYLTGNVYKYLARHQHKNGIEDLNKAIVYIEKLKETYQ